MSVPRKGTTGAPALSRNTRIGLVLAFVCGVFDVASAPFLASGGQPGPPSSVTSFDAVLGALSLVAIAFAWRRRSRSLVRVIAVIRVVDAATTLPAFFVTGVPAGLVIAASAFILLTAVIVMLLMSRGPAAARAFTSRTDPADRAREDLPVR